MAGKGIGYKFPLAPGSVAAELGAFSEPPSRLVAQNQKALPPLGGEGHTYTFPHPPAQALKGRKNARVFWLPLLPTFRAFPEIHSSGVQRISSTVTAAGQRRSFTVFP